MFNFCSIEDSINHWYIDTIPRAIHPPTHYNLELP